MRAIAFYLPQFSPNEYNDKWWGKGFTEWAYVAQAKPLYKNHYQPHIPADLGFYDLRVIQTMKEQQKLAKQYGIYGFAYYHYWFDGKLILHEPLHNLLKNKELDEPFCLCFANHTWSRTWDGSNKEKEILLKFDGETYNPEDHIKYLKVFFEDDRYMKIDNKPVFIIWNPLDFKDINYTLTLWRNYMREYLGKEIYLIATDLIGNEENKKLLIDVGYDAIYEHQPNSVLNINDMKIKNENIPTLQLYSYVKVAEYFSKKIYTQKVFPGIFTSFDSTPRRVENAIIIENTDSNIYKEWLINACKKVEKYESEEQIVFINAWNEWGEGSHLEPDIKYGRNFLEATGKVLENYNVISNSIETYKKIEEKNYDLEEKFKRFNFSLSKDRKTYIWGTSPNCKELSKILKKNNIEFYAYIDNDRSKWGKQLNNKHIISPIRLNSQSDKPYVFIASSYYNEISEQLNSYGYREFEDFINLAHLEDRYSIYFFKDEFLFTYNFFVNRSKKN